MCVKVTFGSLSHVLDKTMTTKYFAETSYAFLCCRMAEKKRRGNSQVHMFSSPKLTLCSVNLKLVCRIMESEITQINLGRGVISAHESSNKSSTVPHGVIKQEFILQPAACKLFLM